MVPLLVPSSATIWNFGFSAAVITLNFSVLPFLMPCLWESLYELFCLDFSFDLHSLAICSPFDNCSKTGPLTFAFTLGVVLTASFTFEIITILSAYGIDYCWMTIDWLECLCIGFVCSCNLSIFHILVYGMLFIWQLVYQVSYLLLSNSNVDVWHHFIIHISLVTVLAVSMFLTLDDSGTFCKLKFPFPAQSRILWKFLKLAWND